MGTRSILTSKLSRLLAGTFLVRVLSVGATFLCSVLLARTLGPEQFGIYSYILAIVSLLALPATAGMPTLVLRETANTKALKDWSKMKGIWLWTGFVIASLSLIIYAFSTVAILNFFEGSKVFTEYKTFALGLIMSLLMAMGNVRGAALRGLGFIIQGQLPESLIRPILLSVFLLLLMQLDINLDPSYAMGLNLIASLVAFIIGAALLIKAKPPELKASKPIFYSRAWLFTILPLALMTGMQSLSSQVDILMLGNMGMPSDVGVYKIVVSGAALAVFGLQVVNMVITPKLASAFAKKDTYEAQKTASIGSLISFGLTFPVVLVFYFFGTEILNLVFGSEYVIGYRALLIISLGQAVNAFFGSSISILTMSGNEKFVIKGMSLSTIVNILLNLALIPHLGIDGAALGASSALLVWNIYLWIVIRRELNIDCTFFGLIKKVG